MIHIGNLHLKNTIAKKHSIVDLIEKGEGLHLDFKFEVSDSAKIARSLASFANTKGGKLLIGVNDDGTIAGISSEEELFMIQDAAGKYCIPEVTFVSKEWNIKGKKVLEINITKSTTTPHRAPDHSGNLKAFVRVADQNMLANGVQMKIWQKLNTTKVISFNYTEDAKRLLSLLDQNNFLSLKQILPLQKLSRFKIENMLAELIIMEVVNMSVNEDITLFSLRDTMDEL